MSAVQKQDLPEELSIRANMLWNSAGSLAYLACQWLTTIVIVRLSTGYDDAGMLSLAMSVVGIFSTFANYKMGTYQVSDIRHEHSLSDYLGFRCFMLAVAFVACMAYAYLTCSPGALLTVALYYVYRGFGLAIDVLHGADQLGRRMDYIGKSFMLQGVLSLASFVAVYALTQSLDGAIVAMTVLTACVLIFFDRSRAAQFEPVRVTFRWRTALFFLKTSLPAVVASLAASALFAVPKQFLSWEFGEAALGIYSSVAAPALVVQMGATYLYNPLLDVFPRLYFAGKRKEFVRLLARTVAGIMAIAVVCSVLLAFFGSWALQLLFGSSIAPYVYLLQPIILSTVLTAFLWFFGDVLIAVRCFRGTLLGNLAAFAAVLPLTFVCVRAWDMNGVSFAGAGACMVGVLVLAAYLTHAVRTGPRPIEEEERSS